jgi:hypothetical protein
VRSGKPQYQAQHPKIALFDECALDEGIEPQMFGRKKSPEDYWSVFGVYIFETQENFSKTFDEHQKIFFSHVEAGTGDKAKIGYDTPRQIWEGFLYVAKTRDKLMENGWLPPREQDVRERYGRGGTLLEDTPTKWEVRREYAPDNFGYATQRFFFDD